MVFGDSGSLVFRTTKSSNIGSFVADITGQYQNAVWRNTAGADVGVWNRQLREFLIDRGSLMYLDDGRSSAPPRFDDSAYCFILDGGNSFIKDNGTSNLWSMTPKDEGGYGDPYLHYWWSSPSEARAMGVPSTYTQSRPAASAWQRTLGDPNERWVHYGGREKRWVRYKDLPDPEKYFTVF